MLKEPNNLDEVLAQVRERIARYRTQAIGEQNTKAALIEPVLRALGWDIEDIDEIQQEYRQKPRDNPVDYALALLRTPRLFVEAKALGGNLEDRRWAHQIMSYATVTGVEWVVLTDGDEYRIYNSHAAVPIEEKLFRSARVSQAGRHTTQTLELLSKKHMKADMIDALWEAHFVDYRIRTAIDGLFSPEPDPKLIALIRERAPRLTADQVEAGLTRIRVRFEFPEESNVPPAVVPVQAPGVEPEATTSLSAAENTAPPEKQDPERQLAQAQGGTPWRNATVRDLITSGLIKPPFDLEKTYRKQHFTAQVVENGTVVWRGRTFDSLSTAASHARASIIGRVPETNGWGFWQFRDTDGRLKNVDVLRQRYFEQHT